MAMSRLLPSLLLAACLLPLTARAEVKDVAANGFTVENSERVPTPVAVAWQVLVDEVGHWWPRDHTWWGEVSSLHIEPVAGGCFCERDGERQAEHMRVVFVDPGRTLRMLGGLGPMQGMGLHGVLEFRLAEVEGGTRITLWYRAGGYTPDDVSGFATIVDRVQAQQLQGLANRLRDRAGAAPD